MKLPVFLLIVLLSVIDCRQATPQEASIKLDPKQKHQKITGWEATAQAGQLYSAAFNKYSARLFQNAVEDLGINRLRLEIGAGVENPVDYFARWQKGKMTEEQYIGKRYQIINDNADPKTIDPDGFQFSQIDATIENIVIPIRKLLAKRGETLFLNLNYVDFGNGNKAQKHSNDPAEYAELMLAAYRHLRDKYGFVPDAIEIILEPDNTTGWTGTEIGGVIVATAERLEADGFRPTFIVPSTTNAAKAPVYIDEIAKVPGAMKYISEFSYHRYCCASDEVLRSIADRAEKYGKQTSMLEKIGADYKALHQDLKIGRNSAWQQYTLAFPNQPDNGAQYYLIDDTDPSRPLVTLARRTKFLRQYFRFIRADAQRIGAETSNPNFDPLAFINKDGRYVVVIKAAVPGTVTVESLPAGVYQASYTTSRETDVKTPEISLEKDAPLKAEIPSAGVITIYSVNSVKDKN